MTEPGGGLAGGAVGVGRIDLTADVSRLRRRLLSLPAVTAVEITPVERAS
jgi:hypothetical protein